MSLFDQDLAEVETCEGIRYLLRRNPLRVEEIAQTRQSKLAAMQRKVNEQNLYLAEHSRAQVRVARRKVKEKIERLKLSRWLSESADEREIRLKEDSVALAEETKLDGCYVLKTDLDKQAAPKEMVHDRYKDLSLVEWAFRCSKTVNLEVRPCYMCGPTHIPADMSLW